MPIRSDSRELHECFAAHARARMTAGGWTWDEDADCAHDQELVAAFRRPAAGEFVATACFVRERTDITIVRGLDPDPQPLVVRAVLGIRHSPGDRLLGLLGDPPTCAIGREAGALLDPPHDSPARVERIAEIPAAVELLARLVEQHADRYAAEHAGVEAMLAGWKARGPFATTSVEAFAAELRACAPYGLVMDAGTLGVAKLPAVLLAAVGHPDEAGAALADALAARGDDLDDADRRFARRLERWLDSGAPIPDRNVATWLRRRHSAEPSGFAEIRRRARERNAALAAVKRAAPGRTREELRALLERELSRRGLEAEPIWVELELDDIERPPTPLDRVGKVVQGVKGVVTLARWGRRILKNELEEPPPQPAWLEPPERAAYDVRLTGADAALVMLDADAADWLERALGAARLRFGPFAAVDVWLAWDREPPGEDSAIVVHLGERRVGTLGRGASERVRPVLEVAAMVGELPRMQAHLARGSGERRPFMLSLPAPEPFTAPTAAPPPPPG